MCGIVGVVSTVADAISEQKLLAMTNVLSHRGPDGYGVWISPDSEVGLGHRRLSVIDVSDNGSQPMISPSGRYVMSYNGEIYNFKKLRKLLEERSYCFVGNSDSEVILAACDEWGIHGAVERLNGMFAIAFWDQKTAELSLVRDRIGIKPLFYSLHKNTFTFASELRPLVSWRQELPPISEAGLNEFFRFGYIPAPLSIFKGVQKLEPGCILKFSQGKVCEKQAYWSMDAVAQAGHENQFSDEGTALDAIENQLSSSIANHMISDVPIGAFLSGGIDSSTVAALMQRQSERPIKTFSIGFSEGVYNEAVHAKAVAKHLGTDHNELYVSEQTALDVVPSLPDIYDEPFADISQIPTFIVSKLARHHVTVALSGDGGDELFGGYNRYVFAERYWERLRRYPVAVRKLLSEALAFPSERSWDKVFDSIDFLMPDNLQMAHPGQKIHKISTVFPSVDLQDMHMKLTSKWQDPKVVLHSNWHGMYDGSGRVLKANANLSSAIQQSLWDSKTYMVDDILTKVDRASMNVALEARVPLLDHQLVELAWRVPKGMKIRNGSGKWILRQLLFKHVPAELFSRPKMGFAVPIDRWLRGSLKTWAEDYLNEEKLKQQGYVNASHLRNVWDQHQSANVEAGARLWTALIFQQWLERASKWI